MAKTTAEYGNDSIKKLEGPDRVRKRPGVIFGSDGLDGCEHSVFEIPVEVFDEGIDVIGDTTAMSTPHEVEYTLTFASDSIQGENGGSTGGAGSTTAAAGIVIIAVAAAIAATVMRKKRNTKA